MQNMVGTDGVTCRSKVAKIILIGIQDGCDGDHLENLFCASSPEPEAN